MRWVATISCLLATLAVGAGCTGDKVTQIIVGVASDLRPQVYDEIGLRIGYVTPKQRVTEIAWRVNSEITLPARFALVPGSNERRVVEIEVEARDGGGTVLARRARLAFARDRIVFLSMNLIARCIGVVCGEDETCGELGCEKVDKNVDQLPDYEPDNEKNAADAGAADGFPDVPEALRDGGDGPRDGPADGTDGPRLDATRDATRDADGDVGTLDTTDDLPGDGPPGDSTRDGAGGDATLDSTADGPTTPDSTVDGSSSDSSVDGSVDSAVDGGGGGPVNNCPLSGPSETVGPSAGDHVVVGSASTGANAGTVYVIKSTAGSVTDIEVYQKPPGQGFSKKGATYSVVSGPTLPISWDAIVHADGTIRLFFTKYSNTVEYVTLPPAGTAWSSSPTLALTLANAQAPIVFDASRAGADRAYIAAGGSDSLGGTQMTVRYEASFGGGFAPLSVSLSGVPPGIGGPDYINVASDGTLTAVGARFVIGGYGGWVWRIQPSTAPINIGSSSGSFLGPVAVAVGGGQAHFGTYDDDQSATTNGPVHVRWAASGGPVENLVTSNPAVADSSVNIAVAAGLPRISYLISPGANYQLVVAQQQPNSSWTFVGDAPKGSTAGKTSLDYNPGPGPNQRLHAAYSVGAGATYTVYYRCVPPQ